MQKDVYRDHLGLMVIISLGSIRFSYMSTTQHSQGHFHQYSNDVWTDSGFLLGQNIHTSHHCDPQQYTKVTKTSWRGEDGYAQPGLCLFI